MNLRNTTGYPLLRRQIVNLSFLFFLTPSPPCNLLSDFLSQSPFTRVWVNKSLFNSSLSAAEFRQLQPVLRTRHVWRIQWELRQTSLVRTQDTSGRCEEISESHSDNLWPSASRTDHYPHTGKTHIHFSNMYVFFSRPGVMTFNQHVCVKYPVSSN